MRLSWALNDEIKKNRAADVQPRERSAKPEAPRSRATPARWYAMSTSPGDQHYRTGERWLVALDEVSRFPRLAHGFIIRAWSEVTRGYDVDRDALKRH